MTEAEIHRELLALNREFAGLISVDGLTRDIFATDASVYQQRPLAVAFPASDEDVLSLIRLARRCKTGLVPRAAGTSLAGQVVGSGIVVDVSRFLTQILEINHEDRWAVVQPGVIRDELNRSLESSGLFFAPETSTSNRAMIGGMLGNNSCGANSIVYGTTRENVISVRGWLADGTAAEFGSWNDDFLRGILANRSSSNFHRVVAEMMELLSDDGNQQGIRDRFPKPSVKRRNTGYALDRLLDCRPFTTTGPPLNLSRLIAGSEGTLFFATAIQLRLESLPDPVQGLYCPHFRTVDQALQATRLVMQFPVHHCELIDRKILQGVSRNLNLREHLHQFVEDPAAVLIVDIRGKSSDEIIARAAVIRAALTGVSLGYAHPLYFGEAASNVAAVRRAGLGLVANVPGDGKPTTVIEDAAVSVDDLPDYIRDVDRLLADSYSVECVHYGHAGAGELHLRPVLNLKTKEGVARFRAIARDVAAIVKRYGGSLSGEHGDGRLRGEFLQFMVGQANYELLKTVKRIWDPEGIFNPGKIVDTPSMSSDLRYSVSQTKTVPTVLDFSDVGGLQRAAEMCNGVGECRKTHLAGGAMCPSYMVTRDELHSTRARANMLRQVLTDSHSRRPLDDGRLNEAMDLCLSCKACKAECPSNVDVAKMKAEFLQAWHDAHGMSIRDRLVGNLDLVNRMAAPFAPLVNALNRYGFSSRIVNYAVGFHARRSLPDISRISFAKWFSGRPNRSVSGEATGTVILFCDEFTNHHDVSVGMAAVELLESLGYVVRLVDNVASGRAAISVGMLRRARQLAETNVQVLTDAIREFDGPVLGLEPSALLTLRDEYPDLVSPNHRKAARLVAERVWLIEEFISAEMDARRINSSRFTDRICKIRLHGHCHQRALASLKPTVRMLQLPVHYQVKLIPAGCCGMAGAFGYEREHFELSMKIGELILFPTVRKEPTDSVIAASGTSCRQQIADGTGRIALHPVQILRDALK